jgi:hypothetical protein
VTEDYRFFIAEVANAVASVHSNHLSSATPRGSLDHGTSSASKLEEMASGSGADTPAPNGARRADTHRSVSSGPDFFGL